MARSWLTLSLLLTACATTRVGVTRPSIFSARFEDSQGRSTEAFSPGEPTRLKVVASGFTPVKAVWLVTADGARAFEVPQATDKSYVLDMNDVFGAEAATDQPRAAPVRIVVVDIEGDEQAETLPLTLQRTAH